MSPLRHLIVAVLTFAIGLLTVPSAGFTPTTLVEISSNVKAFDGKLVEVETYAQLDQVFDREWTAGEPFEKPEIFTFLKLSSEPLQLREQLTLNLSDSEYYRVKVLIRGRVRDNCREDDGITKCCFGISMALEDATLHQTGEVERFIRPVP